MELFDQVQAIVADQLDVEIEDITRETHFENDLEADSLDVFQVLSEVEDELDIIIETDDSISTVQELIDYIEKEQA